MQRAEQEPEVEAFRAANTSLTNDLRELKKSQETLSEIIDNLKKEKDDLIDKIVILHHLIFF